MAKIKRPGPYVPLSVTFHTGGTGTAILESFGLEGLGVWAAMLAAAKDGNPEGWIMFSHEHDWGALGLAASPASFELKSFLTFLGRRKQTRTTLQGRVMYVELTRWGRWHELKETEDARVRKARSRRVSKRDKERDNHRDPERDPSVTRARAKEAEAEEEIEVRGGGSSGPTLTSPPEDDNDEDLVTYEEWQLLEAQRARTEEAERRGQVEA